MLVGEFCNREVVMVEPEESVKTAADLMRKHHVGDVVLVEERGGKRAPIGIVTDRDLVVEVMALGLEPEKLTVRDIVIDDVLFIHENDSLLDALNLMKTKGVRRLPVVGSDSSLVGIIAVDDITDVLTEMLGYVAGVSEHQQKMEAKKRP
ncbi:CBS domain-containing protein [Legionella israelensis]|uniref:CBS domain-containing protein n=1 Tax=Legionella israelensis TaxID=454 RepID=A0AAX1EHB5_9GAMM|nr:CBS domain-containing protein [Legionella israelensis]QBR84479.1 CBS domain-containing protein [Legionella israelensis]